MRLATYTMSGTQRRDALTAVLSGLELVTLAGDKARRTAILAAPGVRVLSTGGLTLPVDERRSRNRAVAQAILGVGGLRVAVAACQFGPQFEERERHSELVLAFLDKLAAPVIFGADFNTSPRGEIPQLFARAYVDAWEAAGGGVGNTYPTPDPSTRRDMLFLSPDFDVVGAAVFSDPPVDSAALHRPVVIDVAD